MSVDQGDLPVHIEQLRTAQRINVVGTSGTGKSTLIRTVIGLETPDAGKIHIDGKDVHSLEPHQLARLRRRIGYLFQSGALLNWMTVAENVELPLLEHRRHMTASERRDRVIEKLKLDGKQYILVLHRTKKS